MIRTRIVGTGSYLPERTVTNEDLEKIVDTSDEWIVQRTGIRERHYAAEGERTSDLGIAAARRALEASGHDIADIDLILVATSTPDLTFPATATIIQAALGMTHGYAFDLQAVCSGFVYALTTADAHLKAGLARRALVIGAETFSRILDFNDRTTCVLFGDGAGAVVLEAFETDDPMDGLIASKLRADGQHRQKLFVDGGVSSTQTSGHLRMEGREVFRHAVGMINDVIEETLGAAGLTTADLDWFIPHQANVRIIDASARHLKIDPAKVVLTVDKHGNTSAASIPLALDTAVRDGRVKAGDVILFEAMGGGFTWGACLMRWSGSGS